jgi:hypothetical protein
MPHCLDTIVVLFNAFVPEEGLHYVLTYVHLTLESVFVKVREKGIGFFFAKVLSHTSLMFFQDKRIVVADGFVIELSAALPKEVYVVFHVREAAIDKSSV